MSMVIYRMDVAFQSKDFNGHGSLASIYHFCIFNIPDNYIGRKEIVL